ncbi:PLC-like phosphodiesterase [Fistulina hepatica ATCC 64428]|uniref:PLC-like phosphodiesterase n=1 Tax=Fistulina hepatica ATCC 64428 TaxID=1128425 RepID=A0A0D7AB82_9AGAR|nr:PLC-like phosphodiesterase [Fistulina hepatica ATCC 64428]
MAFYGWPFSQCQISATPLDVQLHSGVRVIDIRLAIVKDRLIAYHGVFPQRTPFQDILSTIYAFLIHPDTCRETVIMSLKQEDYNVNPPPVFSKKVHDEIFSGPGGRDLWFLENRIPKLGEVRGKIVMLSRFGGDGSGWDYGLEGLGIHPTTWPDSAREGFEWRCKETLVRTHDWYAIPSFLSIPEKVVLASRILVPPEDTSESVLSVSYFSAASFPLAFPSTVARGFGWPRWGFGVEGVNSRLGRWLLDRFGPSAQEESELSGQLKVHVAAKPLSLKGWVLLDYYAQPDHDLVALLVEQNFL